MEAETQEKVQLINAMDVVEINVDHLADDGLNLGDRVIVAGMQAFPVSEDDPYTQRVKLYVQKLNEEGTGVEGGLFMIDPASVKQTGLMAVDDDKEE